MNKATVLVFALGTVLLGALGLQWHAAEGAKPGRGTHLVRVIPTVIPNWHSAPVKLGPSEAVADSVETILRFDDVFFREYRDDERRAFTLYIAYWNPGKMPVQVVASHTPDRCWASAGWRCEQMNYHVILRSGEVELREGQGRLFCDPLGRRQHVIYWHLIAHRLFDFGERSNRVPSAWRWWREVVRQVVGRPEEQYFVRLASERPFEELEGDAGFREILRALGKLGLAAR